MTDKIMCPECTKTWTYNSITEQLAREVDAALHYVNHHTGPLRVRNESGCVVWSDGDAFL